MSVLKETRQFEIKSSLMKILIYANDMILHGKSEGNMENVISMLSNKEGYTEKVTAGERISLFLEHCHLLTKQK